MNTKANTIMLNVRTIAIVLLSCMFISLDSVSQPRANRIANYKIEIQSGILENPIGWCFNYDGKWCGYYGVICGEYKHNSKTPINLPVTQKSFFEDNIISLQFKKIASGGNEYYALYVIKYGGTYDYPIIKEGWHYRKLCNIYLFTKDEYHKLFDLHVGFNEIKSFANTTTTPYLSYFSESGKNELDSGLTRIFDSIDENYIFNGINPKYGICYRWYIKLEEDNKTIRFIMPCCNKYLWDIVELNIQNEQDVTNIHLPQKYDCVSFSNEYFESTFHSFKKLLIGDY